MSNITLSNLAGYTIRNLYVFNKRSHRALAAGQPAALEDASLLRTRAIAFSAEGRLQSASVFLPDGSLLIPEAYACVRPAAAWRPWQRCDITQL